jgi:hypothetical protein
MRTAAWIRNSFVAVSVALAAACGTGSGAAAISGTGPVVTSPVSDTLQVAAGSTIDLRPGQTARVQGTVVALRFIEVRQDSRCPVGAQCVTAGVAQIAVETRNGQSSSGQVILNLTADNQFPSSVTVGGYQVRFAALSPQPQVNGPAIAPSAYTATFSITRS